MLVTEIQRASTHDGPGIRTTVFLKGCPLSCVWCHNPETKSARPQIFYTSSHCIMCGGCEDVCPNGCHVLKVEGHIFEHKNCDGCGLCAEICPTRACELVAKEMDVSEIFEKIKRDVPFYGRIGGITLSGGEPLIHSESVKILKLCQESSIGTAVETCGYISRDLLSQAIPFTDLFLWDIKGGDRNTHFLNTGVYPEKILENLIFADACGAKTILRCIAVNGLNMNDKDVDYIASVYHNLKNCSGVEIIPYHAYGGSKAVQLGLSDNGHKEWIPPFEMIDGIKNNLKMKNVKIIEHA